MTQRVSDWLIPPHCALCGMPCDLGVICGGCHHDLPFNKTACTLCALPLASPSDSICGACLLKPPPWTSARCAFRYEWPIDQVLQHFKYRRHLALGRLLAEQAAPVFAEAKMRPMLLVPVPMPRWRLVRRGFNQAEMLAGDLGRLLRVPVSHGLRRVRHSMPQARLDGASRRRNQQGSMQWRSKYPPGFVAVVDDVMTTGATARECARALREAGTGEVEFWAMARVARPS